MRLNCCGGLDGQDWKWLESVDTDFSSFRTSVVGMESDSHIAYHLLGDDNEKVVIVIILILECCDKEYAISQLLDRIKNKDPSQRPEVLRSVSSVTFKNDHSVDEKSNPGKSNDQPQTSKSTAETNTFKHCLSSKTSLHKWHIALHVLE